MWAQQLGPVPEKPEAAQQWRDTAAELEMFRARYNVPATEAVPVPENVRAEKIGRDLHDRAVTVSKRSRTLPDHATEQDRLQAAAEALERNKDTHAPTAPAQEATDKYRQTNAQEPAADTPVQVEKPRVMTRLQKLVAEQQAKKAAEQAPAEKKPETDAQRQSRLAAERAQREQQRTAAEDLRGPRAPDMVSGAPGPGLGH